MVAVGCFEEYGPVPMSRLGDAVRVKLDAGLLPYQRPEKMFGGYGHHEPCSVCDEPILPAQVEWSIGDTRTVTHRFHLGCFGLWEAEVRRRGAGNGRPSSSLTGIVVIQIRMHAGGLCVSCLSELTNLPLDVVTATTAEVGRVVNLSGINGECTVCGEQRPLIRL
jgi:hypothetical protein